MADAQEQPTPKETATIPPWWDWVARHRKPVALVAGLAVVALVATLVTIATLTPGPKDVVQDYLDAIHAGDTQAALEIAGEPGDDRTRLRFLSPEALADGWSVDAVVERHRRDNEADVDVTLSAGETSAQGRFHLVDGDDGWTIESPFVRIDLTVPNLEAVELGGMRHPVRQAENQPATAQLLLFPGVYELYPSLADQVTFDPPVLIATPQLSMDYAVQLTADYTLTDDGVDATQEAVEARVRDCATKREISPAGCPFSGEEAPAVREFEDVTDVTWKVVTYPEAQVVRSNVGGPALVVRKPGTVKLTGSGIPWEPDGAARTTFAQTCEFGVDNLTVAVTVDDITVNGLTGNRYSAAQATQCF